MGNKLQNMLVWATLLGLLDSGRAAKHDDDVVTEIPLAGFEYAIGSYSKDIEMQNAIIKDKGLYMRSGINKESMVRWAMPNTAEDWSVEIKFNDLNLAAEEKASIYLRYTDEKPEVGTYMGGQNEFHGLIFGLEFFGKSPVIKLGVNDGEDFNAVENLMVKRDFINPRRLRGIQEYRVKFISTKVNLKLIIYNGDEILYDHFKTYDAGLLGMHKPGKYFGIFAHYPSAPTSKVFMLQGAQAYKRIESDKYDPMMSYTPEILPLVRDETQVKHPDHNIRWLIFQIEYLMHFIRETVGELPETKLLILQDDLRHEIDTATKKITQLVETTKNKETSSNTAGFGGLELAIAKLQRDLADLQYAANSRQEESAGRGEPLMKYGLFGAGVVFLYILIKRELRSVKGLSAVIGEKK